MAATGKFLSYARIGLLATAVLLAASLVVGAWLNYRSSRDAVATLYRGQAEVVEAGLRSTFPLWEEEPDSAALSAFVDSFPEYGIRYLAIVDGGGNVYASVGSAVGAFEPTRGRRSAEREAQYTEVGDRVRLVLPLAAHPTVDLLMEATPTPMPTATWSFLGKAQA